MFERLVERGQSILGDDLANNPDLFAIEGPTQEPGEILLERSQVAAAYSKLPSIVHLIRQQALAATIMRDLFRQLAEPGDITVTERVLTKTTEAMELSPEVLAREAVPAKHMELKVTCHYQTKWATMYVRRDSLNEGTVGEEGQSRRPRRLVTSSHWCNMRDDFSARNSMLFAFNSLLVMRDSYQLSIHNNNYLILHFIQHRSNIVILVQRLFRILIVSLVLKDSIKSRHGEKGWLDLSLSERSEQSVCKLERVKVLAVDSSSKFADVIGSRL